MIYYPTTPFFVLSSMFCMSGDSGLFNDRFGSNNYSCLVVEHLGNNASLPSVRQIHYD